MTIALIAHDSKKGADGSVLYGVLPDFEPA